MVRATILIFLAVFAVASAVSAQSTDPAEFERQLSEIRDGAALDAMTQSREEASRAGDAGASLELGLIHLRRWELTRDRRSAERARDAFDRAKQQADSNWAHYGWGLAVARAEGVSPDGARLVRTGRSWAREFGFDAVSRARRSAERALELDPFFDRAAELLAELALFTRDPDHLTQAKNALEVITTLERGRNRTLLMQARVADALNDHDGANAAAAMVVRTERTSETLHALAVSLLRTPGEEARGAAVWAEMLEGLDGVWAERVWVEVSPIADTTELRVWRESDLPARVLFLRRFWDLRAGDAAVTVAERLAEHYRRLGTALERYVRQSDGPLPSNYTLLRDRQATPLDERGIIYLRHGLPDTVISTAQDTPWISGACGGMGRRQTYNESWLYSTETRPHFVHFIRCQGFPDWFMPYRMPCERFYLMDRMAYDDDVNFCDQFTLERTRDFARGLLRTDTHSPRFEAEVPFAYDLLAFRGANGLTDLSAPVAVHGDSVQADTLASGELAYRMTLSMFVVDTARETVARSDTTVIYRADQRTGRNEIIVAYINLSVPPTEDALHRLVVRDGARPARGRRHGAQIRVPSYAGDSLMISSIVMAVPGVGGSWRRGETSLTVMPIGEFGGGDFRVFYEIYNLPPDSPYETEVTIVQENAVQPVVQFRFQDRTPAIASAAVQELRSIDTELPRGQYRLYVRVINLDTRATATSERQFRVTQPTERR